MLHNSDNCCSGLQYQQLISDVKKLYSRKVSFEYWKTSQWLNDVSTRSSKIFSCTNNYISPPTIWVHGWLQVKRGTFMEYSSNCGWIPFLISSKFVGDGRNKMHVCQETAGCFNHSTNDSSPARHPHNWSQNISQNKLLYSSYSYKALKNHTQNSFIKRSKIPQTIDMLWQPAYCETKIVK